MRARKKQKPESPIVYTRVPMIPDESTMAIRSRRIRTAQSKNEILRKLIHAGGLFVPFVSNLLNSHITVTFIFIVTLVYILSEWARLKGRNIPIVSSITRYAARKGELDAFAAAPVFFALGIALTLLVFPAPANSAAIALFAVGDSAASIFGRMFGKHSLPFNKAKTFEGTLSGFLFGFLAALLFTGPFGALVGAITAMGVESLPLRASDNLTVPLVTGAILTIIT